MNCNQTATRRRRRPTYAPHFGNLLNEFFNTAVGDIVTNTEAKHTTNPAVNLRTYEDRWVLDIAIPGYTKEDVTLTIDGDLVKIESKEKEQEAEAPNYRLREFNYAGFSKTFRLPETADTTKISAKHEHGILAITIHKKEEAIPQPAKNIDIL